MLPVRPYYVDLGVKDVLTGMYESLSYDGDGVPLYKYHSGPQYNVTFICHVALYQLSLYQKTRRPEHRAKFEDIARWICANGDESEGSFVFAYSFPMPRLEAPWISALGQGRMLSVLTRAFEMTGEQSYLRLARKAVHPFCVPVSGGGVQTTFPRGGLAFEEYPRAERNIVLNGLITALFGLYDASYHGCDRAGQLFDTSVKSLAENLYLYDLGYWSTYDITGPIRRVAGDEYHRYHVTQLWALYELSGEPVFLDVARRWLTYRKGVRLAVSRFASRVNTVLRYR
jgi:heparosan-N-sulfate-glucuronate 5-epimerase